jgi:hypothetical protein
VERSYRRMLAGMGVAVVSVALVAGCGGDKPKKQAAPAAASDPRQVLIEAAGRVAQGRFQVIAEEEPTTSRTAVLVDPASAKAVAGAIVQVGGGTGSASFRQIGDRLWAQLDLSSLGMAHPKDWMRVDPAKVSDRKEMRIFDPEDPTGALAVIRRAQTVEGKDGKFTGTADLSELTQDHLYRRLVVDGDAMGDLVKKAPFEAVVDGNGRLTSITVTGPGADGGEPYRTRMKYGQFGAQFTVSEPPDTIEATEYAYATLNGL